MLSATGGQRHRRPVRCRPPRPRTTGRSVPGALAGLRTHERAGDVAPDSYWSPLPGPESSAVDDVRSRSPLRGSSGLSPDSLLATDPRGAIEPTAWPPYVPSPRMDSRLAIRTRMHRFNVRKQPQRVMMRSRNERSGIGVVGANHGVAPTAPIFVGRFLWVAFWGDVGHAGVASPWHHGEATHPTACTPWDLHVHHGAMVKQRPGCSAAIEPEDSPPASRGGMCQASKARK